MAVVSTLQDADIVNDVADEDDAVSAPQVGAPGRIRVDDRDAWRGDLITKTGKGGEQIVLPNLSNVVHLLRYHHDWRGVLAWDAFGERIVARRAPPWYASVAPSVTEAGPLLETDTSRIVDWFARAEGMAVPAKVVEQAVPVVAEANSFHPVREYLEALEWDGVPRLATWLSTYCGAEQSPYTAAIGTKYLISAVARAMEPGCQVDCMLILEGPQGIRKSTLFRNLVPDTTLYSETGVTIGDKDSYQVLHGVWIYLLDELDSLKRGDITRTKNFLTSPKDHYRPSYGRAVRDFPRQCVFAGTTNEAEYLVDKTGNRRFWPVRVTKAIDIEGIVRDRDQLWAEALQMYAEGARWYADTPELRALCEAEQAERVEGDAWEGIVSDWLAQPRQRADGDALKATGAPVTLPGGAVLVEEVLVHALGKDASAITRGDQMRVGQILRELGYRRGKQAREQGGRVRRYEPPQVVTVVTERGDTGDREEAALESLPSPPSLPDTRTHTRSMEHAQESQDAISGGDDGDTLADYLEREAIVAEEGRRE